MVLGSLDAASPAADGTDDCQPLVLAACVYPNVRTADGGCAVAGVAASACIEACPGSGIGFLDARVGVCECSDAPLLDNICDGGCRAAASSLALDPASGGLRLTTAAGAMLMSLDAVPGLVTSGDGCAASRGVGNGASPACPLAVLTLDEGGGIRGLFGLPVVLIPHAVKEVAGSRRLQYDAAPPSVATPIACVPAGGGVFFDLATGGSGARPVYLKDSLLSTNHRFDYGAFRALEDGGAAANASALIMTVDGPGLYAFSTRVRGVAGSGIMALLAVMEPGSACPTAASLVPMSAAALIRLGARRNDNVIIALNWALVGGTLAAMTSLAAAALVALAAVEYRWYKRPLSKQQNARAITATDAIAVVQDCLKSTEARVMAPEPEVSRAVTFASTTLPGIPFIGQRGGADDMDPQAVLERLEAHAESVRCAFSANVCATEALEATVHREGVETRLAIRAIAPPSDSNSDAFAQPIANSDTTTTRLMSLLAELQSALEGRCAASDIAGDSQLSADEHPGIKQRLTRDLVSESETSSDFSLSHTKALQPSSMLAPLQEKELVLEASGSLVANLGTLDSDVAAAMEVDEIKAQQLTDAVLTADADAEAQAMTALIEAQRVQQQNEALLQARAPVTANVDAAALASVEHESILAAAALELRHEAERAAAATAATVEAEARSCAADAALRDALALKRAELAARAEAAAGAGAEEVARLHCEHDAEIEAFAARLRSERARQSEVLERKLAMRAARRARELAREHEVEAAAEANRAAAARANVIASAARENELASAESVTRSNGACAGDDAAVVEAQLAARHAGEAALLAAAQGAERELRARHAVAEAFEARREAKLTTLLRLRATGAGCDEVAVAAAMRGVEAEHARACEGAAAAALAEAAAVHASEAAALRAQQAREAAAARARLAPLDALLAAEAEAAARDAQELTAFQATLARERAERLEHARAIRAAASAVARAADDAELARLDAAHAAQLADERACADEALRLRRARMCRDHSTELRERKLAETASLDLATRDRVMREFEADRAAVEAKVDAVRAAQRAALELRLTQRRAERAPNARTPAKPSLQPPPSPALPLQPARSSLPLTPMATAVAPPELVVPVDPASALASRLQLLNASLSRVLQHALNARAAAAAAAAATDIISATDAD